MLRRMSEMPPGTIGFEAIGEVEDDDWEETVEPVLLRDCRWPEATAAVLAWGGGARRGG
jgi:hypothetical protein